MNKIIRVALIGFEYGHQLAYSGELAKITDVTIVGVIREINETEVSRGRALEYARQAGIPCLEGLENGIEGLAPDLVSIALPPDCCGGVVLKLAQRGINVLAEKPMSFDLSQIAAIKIAASTTGAIVALAAASSVYARPIYEAIKLCEEGRIGRIQVVNYQYFQPKGPIFANRTKATGGEFANFAAYGWIPMSIIAKSQLLSVYSVRRNLFYSKYSSEGIDDISITSVRFVNNVIGTITVGRIPVRSIPTADIQLEIIGSTGAIRVTNGIGDCIWLYEDFRGSDAEYDRGGYNKIPYNISSVNLLTESLVLSIRNRDTFRPGIDEILSYSMFAKLSDESTINKTVAINKGQTI